jgi:hypothetical protein
MAIKCIGTLHGGEPRKGNFTVANDAVLSVGEMLTLTSNEADAGTTNDATFIGIALEAVDNSADGESVQAILDQDAVYLYNDGTAHAAGATLDLASGGLGLAANSNADFTVIQDNAATEATKFIITPGEHYLHQTG